MMLSDGEADGRTMYTQGARFTLDPSAIATLYAKDRAPKVNWLLVLAGGAGLYLLSRALKRKKRSR